jgi:hypothetical protein
MVSSIDEFDWKTFKKDQISFESKNVNLLSDIYKKTSKLGFYKLKVVGNVTISSNIGGRFSVRFYEDVTHS